MLDISYIQRIILKSASIGLSFAIFIYCSDGRIADHIPQADWNPESGIKPLNIKREYWPTKGWRSKKPKEAGLHKEALGQLEKYLFTLTGKEEERKGIRTDALLIVKDGYLVHERYGRGYEKNFKHLAWSVTKSFVNAFYGIAVKKKLVRLSDPAYLYFPALDREGARKVTIKHLLEQSSGLDWQEGYELAPLTSSVVAMLYTAGRKDMANFTASRDLEADPNTRWEYSSGNSNLLMGILQNILKERYAHYPWKNLFNVIGMRNVTFERDGKGNYVGSSYLYSTPRELAKFGFLYLNDGEWEGKRILPEGWVRYSAKMPLSLFKTEGIMHILRSGKEMTPAVQWWGNHAISKRDRNSRPVPAFPKDMLIALGHWGTVRRGHPFYGQRCRADGRRQRWHL